MTFFDAPWHIILLLVVVLLLFGSSRLPGAAKALGQSLNIFKKSVKGADDEDETDNKPVTKATVVQAPPQQIAAQSPDPTQQAQIEELQRQLAELQRQSAGPNGAAASADGATSSAAQPNQPSS